MYASTAPMQTCSDITTVNVVGRATTKMNRDEPATAAVPCGCYEGACYCGTVPAEQENVQSLDTTQATAADLDLTGLLRNRFDLRGRE